MACLSAKPLTDNNSFSSSFFSVFFPEFWFSWLLIHASMLPFCFLFSLSNFFLSITFLSFFCSRLDSLFLSFFWVLYLGLKVAHQWLFLHYCFVANLTIWFVSFLFPALLVQRLPSGFVRHWLPPFHSG